MLLFTVFLQVLLIHTCSASLDAIASPWNSSTSPLLPLFWHIPKSAGSTVKFFGECLDLVAVSHLGPNMTNGPLRILKRKDRSILNVDVSSKSGILDAAKKGFGSFVSSTTSQSVGNKKVQNMLMATPYIHDIANHLLTDVHGGLFTVFRHPVERAVSMFYYLQHAHWERSYRPDLVNTTLVDFYKSDPLVERNWMTYTISVLGRSDRDQSKEFGDDDFEYAKEILETKMLVGLKDHIAESLTRFGIVFGWTKLPNWSQCLSRFADHGVNQHPHPVVQPSSIEWKVIAEANLFDMKLYDVAVEFFQKQAILVDQAVQHDHRAYHYGDQHYSEQHLPHCSWGWQTLVINLFSNSVMMIFMYHVGARRRRKHEWIIGNLVQSRKTSNINQRFGRGNLRDP